MPDSVPYPLQSMSTNGLNSLFELLTQQGFRLVGPTIDNGAIIYDEIESSLDLPIGWTDQQAPGKYSLEKRADNRAFGYTVGPQSWKKELFLPREIIQKSSLETGTFQWHSVSTPALPTAFIGVRACDLTAIGIQDRVFIKGQQRDLHYNARRQATFIVAINCTEAGELCFCDSMDSGPRAKGGFDICLTEFDDYFLVEAGSKKGEAIVQQLPVRTATKSENTELTEGIKNSQQQMGRTLNTDGLPELLFGNLNHPQWDKVGESCLACGNCTSVCPSCFCYSVDETADLGDGPAQRERSWDSCFSQDHSKIHGATFQPKIKDRYRQWLTHKFAAWQSQFGSSGCVGCGRCIAWCPVGIDPTEQIAAIQQDAAEPVPLPAYKPANHQAATQTEAGSGNLFESHRVKITAIKTETDDVVTLSLDIPHPYHYQPGQFNMLALPGIGEVPISVSGDRIAKNSSHIEHTIRNVGSVTAAINALKIGDTLGLRGPYGTAWPIAQMAHRPVTVIAGGIGLAPLRGVMRHLAQQIRNPNNQWVSLVYGARDKSGLLFSDEFEQWQRNPAVKVAVTLDRASPDWSGNVGTVTTLLQRKQLPPDGLYLMCGPEVMMAAVIRQLTEANIPPENIYLSMERNMKCAAGQCGRCQYGPYFICKDGPVFNYPQLEFLFGQKGF